MRNGSTACWRVTLSTRVRTAGSIGGQVMWGEVCGPEGERACGAAAGARGVHADDPRRGGCGGRARAAERTRNMALMLVTLDVSKLSGWSKAAAFCRGRKQGV